MVATMLVAILIQNQKITSRYILGYLAAIVVANCVSYVVLKFIFKK